MHCRAQFLLRPAQQGPPGASVDAWQSATVRCILRPALTCAAPLFLLLFEDLGARVRVCCVPWKPLHRITTAADSRLVSSYCRVEGVPTALRCLHSRVSRRVCEARIGCHLGARE